MYVRSFIKNYVKNGKTIQVLTTLVYDNDNKVILSSKYYVNYSKDKNTSYLSEIKD